MNIAVFSEKSGEFYFKPDNTLVRGASDFFMPAFIQKLSASNAIVIRIIRPAKYISAQFAKRYYDEIGFGILLYPDNLMEGSTILSSGTSLALDRTSYTTEEFFSKEDLSEELTFSNKEKRFTYTIGVQYLEKVDIAIEKISMYSSLKSGDLIFIELSNRYEIAAETEIEITYSDKSLLDFFIR
jgi:acylpyruvate hydrolase